MVWTWAWHIQTYHVAPGLHISLQLAYLTVNHVNWILVLRHLCILEIEIWCSFCLSVWKRLKTLARHFKRKLLVSWVCEHWSLFCWILKLIMPRFPIDGFKPLQDPPNVELSQAKELLEFLDRLLPGVSRDLTVFCKQPLIKDTWC
jgi:hypothetical protein